MDPVEYEKLARVEREHWFYRGKREIVRYWLEKYGCLTAENLLVDAGAGSGYFAWETSRFCRVLAVDDHPEALALARERLGSERVKEGSCTALPLPDSAADAATALDVLEHVADDRAAVCELARILKPGGVLVISVPALQILWSDWDVALHHHRRYSRRSLVALLKHAQLDLLHCHYVNVLAFLPILLIRKLRFGASRSEDAIPPAWLNHLLRLTFVAPACQSLIRFPFGVGLLAVVRRNASPS